MDFNTNVLILSVVFLTWKMFSKTTAIMSYDQHKDRLWFKKYYS